MADEFTATDSPYIRISRSGSITQVASAERQAAERQTPVRPGATTDRGFPPDDRTPTDDGDLVTLRGVRPMPKRLSEEVREMEEARRQQDVEPDEPAPKTRAKSSKPRRKKSDAASDRSGADQLPLPLKTPREKTDSMVKQRQVLGLACIVAAVLVLIAIVSYSSNDAAISETKISDLPALFVPAASDAPDPVRDQIRANADLVHNKLGLVGAMLANFLINKTIGFAAILYPIFFGAWSLAFFRFTYRQRRRLTLATTFFLISGVLFSATMGTAANFANIPREWFGSVGQFLGLAFTRTIGGTGAFIIYATAFTVMLIFSIDLDIEKTARRLHGWWTAIVMFTRRKLIEFWDKREARQLERSERRAEEEAAEAELESDAPDESAPLPVAPTIAASLVAEPTPVAARGKLPDSPVVIPEASARSQSATEDSATPVSSESQVSQSFSTPTVAMPVTAAPVAAMPVPPIPPRPQFTPGQPLLKVRPAPKPVENGAPIPRLTRNGQDKLGVKSVHFSRLTNGAVPVEEELPQPPESSPAIVPTPTPLPATQGPVLSAAQAAAVEESSNVDSSEQVISPFTAPPKQKGLKSEAAVLLGDEKTLSNESLPHSVIDDKGLPVLPLDTAPAIVAGAIVPGKSEDLFFEEGKKPVVPENPYLELLTKFRNPPIDILTPADPRDILDAHDEELAKKGLLLRDKLATFGVEIENITVTPGPVVTLYEFTPAEGVKVSRVENLTDDIALAMKARGIRIIAPIPGKGTIGVEIPNDVAKIVRIREMFESESFKKTKMNLPVALGKTISGDVYVDDLNRMPHLLIAGATGSGKSVGVNGIIASLLYAKAPRDVKFVIIDPKKIELSLYKKLRKHYLIVSPEAGEDIVTTPAYAVLALKAVEIEMERRYDKLAKAAVRSLADYNIKVAQGRLRSTQEEQHYHLPYIVVVIDELADLMITAAREIEEPICRIAQMARAVGIHLILATQRPSVDVITGVIKANFPARMAFQVATRVDSRTILDGMGAEQLLGNGDMLYQPSGTPKPIRLQSPFISTEEVEAIIDAIAVQEGDKLSYSRPWTLPSLRTKEDGSSRYDDEEDSRDELFEEAAKTIVRHQQGSVSLLQRRLKVGYSRAARIVDELEQAGIVGPFDGSKAREVLCESEAELEVVLDGLR
ncbi:MAG: DNA translocase FtsK 4TM domain-containing protein [Bacteroidota bacterium]|nr:DNA translocase FtsK 4TM domain-containing protein [Bacteroidota bacterium]MDP4232965.1 DNA translocase FtsK 4TM domain-containing protein [Bacteroidota bacterium]MDP4242009.1 DNA translocase FtsK 4TM domain-containing protein [Bacteroidota bacterium]MDP4286912.1 DNA translocase FtsK 4TM domain-containing protein [Bacteroidota bacterium]